MSRVLIIGPGKSFGKFLIQQLLAHGYEVTVLSQRRPENSAVSWIQDNLIDQNFINRLKQVVASRGMFDCILFNAKNSQSGCFSSKSLHHFEDVYQCMVFALMQILAELPTLMVSCGTFIVTGGGYAYAPNPDQFQLSLAKIMQKGVVDLVRETLEDRSLKILTIDGRVDPDEISPESVVQAFFELLAGDQDELVLGSSS